MPGQFALLRLFRTPATVAGVLSCVCSAEASAQVPTFQRVPDAAGLSHNTVHAIEQDRDGYLWVGTADGLNRFDGYEFRVFRPNGENGLSGNLIWDVHEDAQGILWVLTGDGIDRYDRRTDRFETVDALASARLSLTPGHLFEDSRGTLWISTGGGLFKLPDGDGWKATEVQPVSVPGLQFTGGGVVVVQEDPSGRLWVKGPQGRVWDLLGEIEPSAPEDAAAFLIDSRGRHLRSLDPIFEERMDGAASEPGSEDLPLARVWAIHEDRLGTIWLGTANGVVALTGDGEASPITPVNPEKGHGYIFDFVRSIHEDRAGTLWVGTHGGLFRYDPNLKEFRHLGGDPNNPTELSGSVVSAIEETENSLWVGTLGAGVNRVDRETGLVERLPLSADPGRRIVWALKVDVQGRLWIGSAAGLDVVERGSSTPHPFEHDEVLGVAVIAHAPDGGLWVLSTNRLLHLSARTAEVSVVHCCDVGSDNGEGGLAQSLHVGRDGTVWVGVGARWLFRYDPASGEGRTIPLSAGVAGGLGIWDIFEDRGGVLWLGMGSGLGRFNPKTEDFRLYTTADGLPGSVVFSIEGDPSGRVWLGTNQGLSVFDPAAKPVLFRTYGITDGVGNLEFNRRAATVGLDGTLYFGGVHGLTFFRPADIRTNPVPPPVVLTSIESVGPDGAQNHPAGTTLLRLGHRENTISFEFSALSFTNPVANQYRYRLADADADWVEAGDRRYARYAGLSAGDYTFTVLGSNEDGVWSPDGPSVQVVIDPPWWEGVGFRLGMVLATALLLTLLYRRRVAGLLAVERMRLSIAGDLHDELASDLSGIALLGETLQKSQALDAGSADKLGRIAANARRMVNDVRDIVWAVDPAHDSLTDLTDHLREIARAMLGEGAFTFRATLGPDDRDVLGMMERRQIVLICKEILHNVVRHAQAASVDIEVTVTNASVHLTVSDDGLGFDQETLEHCFGLDQLQRRSDAIGGSIEIIGRPGIGTTVSLTVPRR